MQLTNLKFLRADHAIEGKVVVQCNEFPVMNGVGDTFEDAMEQMCLILLVYLRGLRTGEPYVVSKARGDV